MIDGNFEVEFETTAGKRIVLRASSVSGARALYDEFARELTDASPRTRSGPHIESPKAREPTHESRGPDDAWERLCGQLKTARYAQPLRFLAAIKACSGSMITTAQLIADHNFSSGGVGAYSRVIGELARAAGLHKDQIFQVKRYPTKDKRPAEYQPGKLLLSRSLPAVATEE